MRFPFCALGLFVAASIAVLSATTSTASADEPIYVYRTRTASNLEYVDLNRQQYGELMHKVLSLSAEIKLAKAERASIDRRIAEYERFKTNAFFLTLERLRLERMEADMRVDHLLRERLMLQYYGPRELRLRRMQMEQTPAVSTIY